MKHCQPTFAINFACNLVRLILKTFNVHHPGHLAAGEATLCQTKHCKAAEANDSFLVISDMLLFKVIINESCQLSTQHGRSYLTIILCRCMVHLISHHDS